MHAPDNHSKLNILAVDQMQSNQPTLMVRALGAAAHLIQMYGDRLDFYFRVTTPTLERWMLESFPDVVQQLKTAGEYECFVQQLDAYRESVSSASTSAKFALEYGPCDVLGRDRLWYHRIFTGMMSRIAMGHIHDLDEEQLLAAFLLDKHTPVDRQDVPRESIQRVARHTEVQAGKDSWDWWSMEKMQDATSQIAYLVPREHFPGQTKWHTHEEFALLVRVPANVPLSSLVTDDRLDAVNLVTEKDAYERCLALGGCPVLLPLEKNEESLNFFRNYLTVLYLQGPRCLLVEYRWNPVVDFDECMYPSDDEGYYGPMVDYYEEVEEVSHDLEDFKMKHPHAIRISEIRPIPLLKGSQRPPLEPGWELDIPS
jgi:hypothetical protein